MPGSENHQGDTGIGAIEIAMIGEKGKAAQQLATAAGPSFKLFTGKDLLDPALMEKKMQLMQHCRFDCSPRTA